MPLPSILKGTAKRCRARTKSRNLAPCFNLAAWNNSVCTKHGAVHPDKRATGKSHGRYKHGDDTKEVVVKRKEQLSTLQNIEDILFLIKAIDGKQHKRGKLPANYQKIKTLQQAKDFITKLEANK